MLKMMEATTKTSLEEIHADLRSSLSSSSVSSGGGGDGGGGGRAVGVGASGEMGTGVSRGWGGQDKVVDKLDQLAKRLDEQSEETARSAACVRERACVRACACMCGVRVRVLVCRAVAERVLTASNGW